MAAQVILLAAVLLPAVAVQVDLLIIPARHPTVEVMLGTVVEMAETADGVPMPTAHQMAAVAQADILVMAAEVMGPVMGWILQVPVAVVAVVQDVMVLTHEK
jgi:hypothetical protein